MASDLHSEIQKGRVALWLDSNDLEFLACEYSRLPENTPEDVARIWMRIASRAHAALQKSGRESLPFEPGADRRADIEKPS